MSPLQSKRDIWSLGYYLTENRYGQDVGRFDAYCLWYDQYDSNGTFTKRSVTIVSYLPIRGAGKFYDYAKNFCFLNIFVDISCFVSN